MAAPVIQQYGAGSQFIGCPAVYQITPTGAGNNKTFYRMKVKVVAGMTGIDNVDFNFSTPIEVKNNTAQNTYFDISSALQAIADQWQPSPGTFSYPAINFYMEAEEEWMNDGTISHSDTARYPGFAPSTATMYMGKLTDRERLTPSPQPPSTYSRKPTSSPEICFHDFQVIVPNSTDSAPSVTLYLAGDPGESTFASLNYYIIQPPPDGHEIRFINSLGVHENIFVAGLPTKEVNIATDKYTIAREETLTQFSRGLAVKQNDYETWMFSSGPLDEAWASWYIHEFLMARWVWISVPAGSPGGITWIPCHVLPDETTTLISRSDAKMLEVIFKLQLDINGSPM